MEGTGRGIAANSILHLVIVIAHGLGAIGLTFVLYGAVATYTGETWKPIEPYVRPISIYLVLLGLFITSVSVYCPWEVPRPIHLSRYATAPVAIALVFAGIYFEITRGIPKSTASGFALLTIAGAMLRMFPRPEVARADDIAQV